MKYNNKNRQGKAMPTEQDEPYPKDSSPEPQEDVREWVSLVEYFPA